VKESGRYHEMRWNVGFLNLVASTPPLLASLLAVKTPDNNSCLPLVSPLGGYPLGPTHGFPLDATPT
jgi:hypothetical protein